MASPVFERVRGIAAAVDPFVAMLLATLFIATVLPARGTAAELLPIAGSVAVAVLFFVSGLRLSPAAVAAGIRDWRLQATILAMTFVLFPAIGWAATTLATPWLSTDLALGLLFLAALPSVVQTSTAFTSIAGGNAAASVCAASASNLLGIVLTPVLVAVLTSSDAGIDVGPVLKIVSQILVPFAIGQLLHGRFGEAAARHASSLRIVDRGAILLIVYSAFGAAVVGGVWERIAVGELLMVVGLCAGLLILMLAGTWWAGRRLGFSRENRIPLMFCGAEKSLTTGLPIAAIIFAGPMAGVVVIPVIIYHQLQLLVCALLARRLAEARSTP